MFTLVTSPASQLVINRLNYLFIVPDLLILVCVCVCVCVCLCISLSLFTLSLLISKLPWYLLLFFILLPTSLSFSFAPPFSFSWLLQDIQSITEQ